MRNAPNISTSALRRRIVNVSVFGVLAAAILVGAATAVPSFFRFSDAHQQELARSAEFVAQSLNQFLTRAKAMARQSANQLLPRQLLNAHNLGDIDADQFRTAIMPHMRDVVAQHGSLHGIVRFDRKNGAVASVGMEIPQAIWPKDVFSADQMLVGQLHEMAGAVHLAISIPIIDPNFGRIGTDILMSGAKDLLGLLEPSGPVQGRHICLLVPTVEGPLFLSKAGFFTPEGLADFDAENLPGKGFVLHEGKEIGFASVGVVGWRVLIVTDSKHYFASILGDISKVLMVALLVTMAIGGAVYVLMAPLAEGLIVHTKSLEDEVAERTKELNESEERFRGFAEAASDWFWETDADHRFTYLSAAYDAASGTYSSDRVLGKTRWEIHGTTVDADWAENQVQMEAHEPIVGFEYGALSPDGEEKFLRISGKPRFNSQGEFLGYLGVGRNVTELRRAQSDRDRADRLFVDAISSVPVAIALFDPDDCLMVWNDLYAREIAKDIDLAVGRSFEEITRQAVSRGRVSEARWDGEEWIQKRLRQHRNPEGSFAVGLDGNYLEIREHRTTEGCTILIAHDVTREKNAESDLRKQKDLLETVFDTIPTAIFLKDRDGVFTDCNEQFYRSWDFSSKDDVIGKTTYDIAPDRADAKSAAEGDRWVMGTGQALVNMEQSLTRKDGSKTAVVSSKVPLRNPDGEVVGILGVFTDITERKRAETELAASETRFRALIDNSPDWILLKDRDGKYLLVNKAVKDLRQLSAEGFDGKTAFDFFPRDVANRITAQDRKTLESGKLQTVRNEVVFADGKTHIVDSLTFPVPGADGKRTGLGCISRDVTEQVLAEQTLQEERNFLNTVLETNPNFVYWKDRDLVYRGSNTRCAQFWGYSTREELIGKRISDTHSNQADIDSVEAKDRVILENGEAQINFEYERTDPDGSVSVHLSSKAPLFGPDGEITGILGSFSDITERKQIERRLAENEERFRLVTESSTDGIVAIDDSGVVISWNGGAQRMFGRDAASMKGQLLTQIIPERHRAGHTAGLARCMKSGEFLQAGKPIEIEGLRADGTEFPVELSLGSWESGGHRFFCGVVRDITERKRTEETLRRSQKIQSLGNLAAGMAHEINNLLLPISTLTRMTVRRLPEDSTEKPRLEMVIEAAERAARIIAGVMEFARQDTGERSQINPRDAVEKALKLVRPMLPATVNLERRLASNVGQVNVNPDGISVVISNLVANAVDALEGKPGNLRISLQRVEPDQAATVQGLNARPHALILVADTGCGMNPETVERALDPFFTTKVVGEGTGLGLSVAHGVVDRHDGFMSIESAPGTGTKVRIYLPLVEGSPEHKSVPHGNAPVETDLVLELERKYGARSCN